MSTWYKGCGQVIQTCFAWEQHEWEEVYYGNKCARCGLFFPFDGAPWDEPDDESWDDDGA